MAIAVSPVSLQMLTVNSVKNAIPVIFIRSIRNSLFIAVLFDNVVNRSIIAPILYCLVGKFFKNPYPDDIAVVNIAIKITIP